ncbi:MAG: hypothetical protein ABSB86_10430 [Bryobacteraceae bacterium]|jgi:hypothetical protein
MFRYLQALALVGASFGLVPLLHADQLDKKTVVDLNAPVAVEDVVLPPGEYVMKLLNSQSSRQIVEIFNRDQTHLLGTVLGVSAYRPQPTGDTRFTYYEVPAGQPRAMRTWFYPGDSDGIEFRPPAGVSGVKSDTN